MQGNTHTQCCCKDEVLKFLDNVAETEGEPYASQFVRTIAGCELRDEEKGILELPPSYTKRKLYERFCFENGWIASADAKGNYSAWNQYKLRPHDDINEEMAAWPSETSVTQVICSWATFWDL